MTDHVSANIEDLATFVDHGHTYVEALKEIETSITVARHGARSVGLDFVPHRGADGLTSEGSLAELIAEATNNNIFIADLRQILKETGVMSGHFFSTRDTIVQQKLEALGHNVVGRDLSLEEDQALSADLMLRGIPEDSPIREAILHDGLAPPTDEIRDGVANAMLRGETPDQAGLDPRYFPPEYRELSERLAENDAERAELEERTPDGPLPPGHSSRGASRELAQERAALLEEYGLVDLDPEATLGDASGDTADLNELHVIGATGAYLGIEWQGHALDAWYQQHEENRFGGQQPGGPDPMAMERLSEQLADSTETATIFFNARGPAGTAWLSTEHHPENPDVPYSPETIHNMSIALGHASKTGDLTFSGDEVIRARSGPHGLDGPKYVTLLFTEGDFDRTFLVDATTAQLQVHDDNDQIYDYKDQYPYGNSGTNILLRRATETPGISAEVVRQLGPDGAHYYLNPSDEFVHDEQLEQYPITLFLGAAGADPAAAAMILTGAADVEEFSDTGVAGGVDAVMGQHATIMYASEYLAERGITPGPNRLDQEEWLAMGHSSGDWKSIRGKVLEHGQGHGLVIGNNALIQEAINFDLADGQLGETDEYYELMAINSGVLDEQWFQAVLDIKEEEDAAGARNNGYLAAAFSVSLSVVGALTLPATAAGAAVGLAGSSALSGVLTVLPVEVWGTDAANTELRQRLTEQRHAGRVWREMVIVPAIRHAARNGKPVRTTSGYELSIVHVDGVETVVAIHPETGERIVDPNIDWQPDHLVGDAQNDTYGEIHDFFKKGQDFKDTGSERLGDPTTLDIPSEENGFVL